MGIKDDFKFFSVIFLSFLFISGCSVKSNLDEMHDKTNQMADTTEGMAKESKEIKSISESTYYGLRAVDARKLRDDTRNCVINTEDLSDKLACAMAYFYAFEFQNWKDEGPDNQDKLDSLKEMAVREFFEFLKVFWGPNQHIWQDIEPLAPNTMDLYAFAANLHQIYPDQDFQGAKKGFTSISMLTILQDGLLSEYKNPSQDPNAMPKWMYYVRASKTDTIELLKKRITFLPFLSYAFLNHLERKYSLQLMWGSGLVNRSWNVNLDDYTLSELDYYTLIIRRALMTRQFLNEINIDAVPDNGFKSSLKIQNIYKNMKVNYDSKMTTLEFVAKEAQMKEFQKLTNLLMGPRDEFKKVDPATYVIP